MVKSLKVFAMSVALLGSALASSWASADGKIAVLDIQTAVLGTDEAQKRFKAMHDKPDYKASKAEFDKLQKEGNDLMDQLRKDSATMSAEQKNAVGKKIQDKREDIEHVARKLQAADQEVAQQLMQDLDTKLKKVISDIIKSEGIGLVLDRRAAIIADNSYNITPKVIDALNKP